MFKAGTATTLITPTEPLWLAGYLARTRPATDKVSDLRASAIALEDVSGNRLVMASIDLIAITPIISNVVYREVAARIGLLPAQLVLAASHTHYGPEFRPDKALFFKIPQEYTAKLEAVARQMADALTRVIVEASGNLESVELFAGRTSASFAHNRRRAGVKDGTASTHDLLDQDAPILEVSRSDGTRKAIVFGYACHNTTIPPEDCRYCADWAGFAKSRLEQANPGATALFLTGCGADQNPEPRGSVGLSERYGSELAGAIQSSLDSSQRSRITGSIRVAREEVELFLRPVSRLQIEAMIAADDPPQNVKGKFLLDQITRGETLIPSYRAPMQAVRIGEQLLMILLSGEAVIDWAIKFKREFADQAKQVWVAGYCNDMFGYLPTRRIQQEGGYEGGRANLWSWIPAPFTDDVEDLVTAAVKRLVARVST